MRSGLAQRMARFPQLQGLSTPGDRWDATKKEAPHELLQDSFQLAHFILPDRATAIDIVVRALEKTRIRSRREIRRLYWRDKHAERPVRRIARSDADMLQWLIMFESEQDERAQERIGNLSPRSMAIRYVKHLVQVTTALSSFHVNVGLTRLLHNYTTAEAQRVYEVLTSRYLGADEYRRAKAALMDKLSQRFAGFVKITRVGHGEHRFETSNDQERWADVVTDCLRAFTPWSTQRLCPPFVSANGKTESTPGHRDDDSNQNEMEMRCCHILIEPVCYRGLMKELAFEPPDTKLALPRFVMPEKLENSSDDNSIHRGRAPELSQEDLDEIERRLAGTDARRRNIDSRFVAIVIDGAEQARLDLTETRQLQLQVEAGTSLVEIRGEDDRGDLVLATHIISYANDAFEFSNATAILNKGRMKLRVTPIVTPGHGPSRATLTLSYHRRLHLIPSWFAWRGLRNSVAAIRSYALAGVVIALIGWGVAGAFFARKVRLLEQQLQQAHRNQQLLPTTAGAMVSYRLARDDQRVRGAEIGGIPEISLRLHSQAICLELPLFQAIEGHTYNAEVKTLTGDRTLLTQNFLRARRKDPDLLVEIVLPTDLLKSDTYYTVYLHSAETTDRFTFKVSPE